MFSCWCFDVPRRKVEGLPPNLCVRVLKAVLSSKSKVQQYLALPVCSAFVGRIGVRKCSESFCFRGGCWRKQEISCGVFHGLKKGAHCFAVFQKQIKRRVAAQTIANKQA
eukprot:2090886-Amphidinium_carterae.1